MINEELRSYSDEDLNTELQRREDIKNGEWPKTFVVELAKSVDGNEGLNSFLEEQCGFFEDSHKFNQALSVLGQISVVCEVDSEGGIRVVEVIDGQ